MFFNANTKIYYTNKDHMKQTENYLMQLQVRDRETENVDCILVRVYNFLCLNVHLLINLKLFLLNFSHSYQESTSSTVNKKRKFTM